VLWSLPCGAAGAGCECEYFSVPKEVHHKFTAAPPPTERALTPSFPSGTDTTQNHAPSHMLHLVSLFPFPFCSFAIPYHSFRSQHSVPYIPHHITHHTAHITPQLSSTRIAQSSLIQLSNSNSSRYLAQTALSCPVLYGKVSRPKILLLHVRAHSSPRTPMLCSSAREQKSDWQCIRLESTTSSLIPIHPLPSIYVVHSKSHKLYSSSSQPRIDLSVLH
jgi:hypothetical protein